MKYLALCALVFAGCSSGSPSGATCPTGSTLGYANGSAGTDGNFGSDFFGTYCTSCHSAKATNRHGAPSNQNYDTESEIFAHADDIDLESASGPSATNTDMPDLSGDVKTEPTDAERAKLGEYLACGTAK